MDELAKVNRFEVIDHTSTAGAKFGRVLTKWVGVDQPFHVTYDIQDGGKTLKVFLSDEPKEQTSLWEK